MSALPSVGSKDGHAIRPDMRAQIERVIFDLRLGEATRHYVWTCIDQGPSRQVQGRGGNVLVNYQSRKTGIRLLLESRRGEYAGAVLLDQDPNVLAFFAQPPQVDLQLLAPGGEVRGRTRYTPDMLVVLRDRIVVRETRDNARLVHALMKNPYQFYRDDAGVWHYRAAEDHFRGLGLHYELLSNQALPAQLVENTRFLEDYATDGRPSLDPERALQIRAVMQEQRCCSLHHLLDRGFSANEIYTAIVDEVVYVDLNTDRLAASGELLICSDRATHQAAREVRLSKQPAPLPIPGTLEMRPGSKLRFGSATYCVLFVSHDSVLLQDEIGRRQDYKLHDILKMHGEGVLSGGEAVQSTGVRPFADVSPDALDRAMDRLNAMRAGASESYSARSISRFRTLTAHARNDADALLLLVDKFEQRGNRERRISETNQELIEAAIHQYYNQPEVRGYKGVWDKYCGMCDTTREADGSLVRPIGYPAFTRHAARLDDPKARRGKRAAYQVEPLYAALDNGSPVHGVRPHEVCYVDHTTANIALVSPNAMALGKPTLTLAVDGFTTHPRAQVLSFDAPSARTVLMVLRDYVRRHQRLPRILSIDNGPEFRSRELQFICSIYNIELRFRPPARARHGAMVERLLGASEDEVLSELLGNTRIMKQGTRQVTKSVDPFSRAEWTLAGLHGVLEKYLFEERPERPHPALGVTPNAFETEKLRETGDRSARFVHFDENLLLMTSPHPKRAMHKVDRQRGVWVGGIWYNHPALRDIAKGTSVEVRIEPWHASVVYVQVGRRWVTATGNCQRWLSSRTSREVEVVLREERRRATHTAARASVDANLRSKRHRLWKPEDFDSRLAEQQRETRHLLETLGMTVATQDARAVLRQLQAEPQTSKALPTLPSAPQAQPMQRAEPETGLGIAKATTPEEAPASLPLRPAPKQPNATKKAPSLLQQMGVFH